MALLLHHSKNWMANRENRCLHSLSMSASQSSYGYCLAVGIQLLCVPTHASTEKNICLWLVIANSPIYGYLLCKSKQLSSCIT